MNKKNIKKIKIPFLPPIDIQNKIIEELDKKESKKQELLKQIADISKEQIDFFRKESKNPKEDNLSN